MVIYRSVEVDGRQDDLMIQIAEISIFQVGKGLATNEQQILEEANLFLER